MINTNTPIPHSGSFEKEDLSKFPSLFQQARNLATQAWVSGKGMLQGNQLLASADKAYARLEICKMCEFFKENRCLKCGCYMDKKAHIELAQCPVNKWGPELQRMNTEQKVQENMKKTVDAIDIEKFPLEDKEKIKALAERSLLKYDGRFSYKDVEYIAMFKTNAPTQYYIYEIQPSSGKRMFLESLTHEKRRELFALARDSRNPEGPVEIVFDNVLYRVTPKPNNRISVALIKELPKSN